MKVTFFFDRNPAIDEYTSETIGFFMGSFCVLGLWKARYASQFGIVIFNHAMGIWFE